MYDKVTLFLGTEHRDTDPTPSGGPPTLAPAKASASYSAADIATADVPAVVGELVYKVVRDFPRPMAVLAQAAMYQADLDGPLVAWAGDPVTDLEIAFAGTARRLLAAYEHLDEQRHKKPCG